MSAVPSSHLLPPFARVDLAFERGEGVWLTATNGERYLDFASGVAVNAATQRTHSPERFRRLSAARDVVLDNENATIWPESGASVVAPCVHTFLFCVDDKGVKQTAARVFPC